MHNADSSQQFPSNSSKMFSISTSSWPPSGFKPTPSIDVSLDCSWVGGSSHWPKCPTDKHTRRILPRAIRLLNTKTKERRWVGGYEGWTEWYLTHERTLTFAHCNSAFHFWKTSVPPAPVTYYIVTYYEAHFLQLLILLLLLLIFYNLSQKSQNTQQKNRHIRIH